jgi:predicted flap endonuclease-1-like 5' DNA nuclease
MMDGFTPQLAMSLLGTIVAGTGLGWLIRGAHGKRRMAQLADEWQIKLDNFVRQRDRLTSETNTLRAAIEKQQGQIRQHEIAIAKGRTELESAHEKEKRMSKDLFTLRAEREDFKTKMTSFQDALLAVKRHATELQNEFVKSREFYKGELTKSFEKRKALEAKIEDAKMEHESFSNLLQSSRSEHESVNKMLASARVRLDNLDTLEQKAIALEAENAQLNHDFTLAKQEIETLQRDVAEMDELKVQNKELAQCVASMENSRKQYENDAKRYKEHAGEYEKKSETLRIKLDEVEKNFADIEKQQRQALKDARKPAEVPKANGKEKPEPEKDNLQEIVGIGKVFERALHDLGIFSFRQIANFGVADIARVNAELKESRGRLEQDDWIGQAKELHFNKYGQQ